MIRRYFATGLIVIFFAYAAYLIVTDGGKENTTITFAKLNENISNKFMVLTGQKEPEMTLEEIAKKNELDLLKANSILTNGATVATAGNSGSSGSGSSASGSSGTGDAGNANSSNTGNPSGSTGSNSTGNTGGSL